MEGERTPGPLVAEAIASGSPASLVDGTPMAHGDHQSELDQKLNLRWEQAHNLKVVGSNPSPATTFTEPR